MVSTVLLPLAIALAIASNLRQAGLYAEIHSRSIVLTSRSSTCLLRSKNPGTSTEQVLSMIFFGSVELILYFL